jgi:hypothetical protein
VYPLLEFLVAISLALAPASSVRAQIAFDDATATVGITHVGPSWGAAWGDFNGDGRPDLWAGNHNEMRPPSLYLNQPNGTFQDIAPDVIVGRTTGDRHGAAWADFDNDGDEDLISIEGNSLGFVGPPNQLFVNRNGQLVDEATTRGVAYPDPNPFHGSGGGMTPLWFDFDRDGVLDLVEALGNPSVLFSQKNGVFTNVTAAMGFLASSPNRFAQITGFGGGAPPLLMLHSIRYPDHAYRYDTIPFQDLTQALNLGSRLNSVQDVAIADFNGDLRPDLFYVQRLTPSDLVQIDANHVRSDLQPSASEIGFSLRSNGDITVQVAPTSFITPQNIFVGGAGAHPQAQLVGTIPVTSYRFTVSATDPSTLGLAPHSAGSDYGLYIGRDASGLWQVVASSPTWVGINLEVSNTQPLTAVTPINFVPSDGALPNRLLTRTDQGYVDVSAQVGLSTPTACESAGVGDFDNDMDVDIFLVCTREAKNIPDVLLENTPSGFVPVPNAGGAAGTDLGHGISVAVADYDQDGFLDLFTLNGGGAPFFNVGPDQLFHNRGNGNHWIEIDLEGVVSNRDGIGARVLATAGGKTQLREQNGGMHRYVQNQSRLHFGLGPNTVIDKLRVEWPSGAVQQVTGIPSDQVLHVVEPSTPSPNGKPSYQAGVNAGVFLWRDATTGIYSVRASGDGTASTFAVRLLSSALVTVVGGVGLESGDVVSGSPNGFALTANVTADEDGIDFRLAPGSSTLVAVERDGQANPRLLHVGASGAPPSPSGWVRELDALPGPPSFQPGADLGLFIGRQPATNTIAARWSGDGVQHTNRFVLFASRPFTSVKAVGLESTDAVVGGPFTVTETGTVGSDADGLDLTVQPGSRVGIVYLEDGLFQPQRANPATRDLGGPNAAVLVSP